MSEYAAESNDFDRVEADRITKWSKGGDRAWALTWEEDDTEDGTEDGTYRFEWAGGDPVPDVTLTVDGEWVRVIMDVDAAPQRERNR